MIELQGVELMNCQHNFCRTCLIDAILHNHNGEASCPMAVIKCGKALRDEEIEALLTPAEYKNYLQKVHQKFNESIGAQQRNTSTVPALLELENYDFVPNQSVFECKICLTEVEPGDGLILKNCLHEYCKVCLAKAIELSEEVIVPCPFVAEDGTHCEGFLQDRELRSLITQEIFEAHLARSLSQAEAVIKNSFHCKSPNCHGWAELMEGTTQLHCPVCMKVSCVKCEAVHEGRTCEQHFFDTHEDERKTRDDELTKAQLNQLVNSKQAMPCPRCGVVIQKTAGCNHMKCKMCKHDFQWLGLQ